MWIYECNVKECKKLEKNKNKKKKKKKKKTKNKNKNKNKNKKNKKKNCNNPVETQHKRPQVGCAVAALPVARLSSHCESLDMPDRLRTIYHDYIAVVQPHRNYDIFLEPPG
eukprot:gene5729-biopygen162